MIKFEGKASKRIQQLLLKRLLFGVVLANMIFIFILGMPVILFAIYKQFFIFLLIVCAVFVLSILFCFFNLVCNIPYRIIIEDELIIGKYKESEKVGEVINVKKVVDYGDFYDINFYFPRWRNCICQKDLIKQGTIEEFEKLFEGKIVRKYKSK